MRGEYLPPHGMRLKCLELPPRARRIPVSGTKAAGFTGTTSACAENTLHVGFHILGNRNYLRVRGEYLEIASHAVIIQELPPRARRIQDSWYATDSGNGTTSACAENTTHGFHRVRRSGNYLRVRGEYTPSVLGGRHIGELPPRARRILSCANSYANFCGTTSACAENTGLGLLLCYQSWNYLRVRGEYPVRVIAPMMVSELPPRARRIRVAHYPHLLAMGTTSACAENTDPPSRSFHKSWNYLRVRGEYLPWVTWRPEHMELPPRARRIRQIAKVFGPQPGTTSACAENTYNEGCPVQGKGNYLRVRGEYLATPAWKP